MTSDAARPSRAAAGATPVRNAARVAVALVGVAVLAGCASGPGTGTREYLDEHSAATVTVVQPGITFARDRTDLAAHARDYFTIVAVDVNRMGTHEQYFYCMDWSTIDKRAVREPTADGRQYRLVADGRAIPLTPTSKSLREIGVVERPIEHQAKTTSVLLVPMERDVIEYVAQARTLRILLDDAGTSFRYDLWSGDPGSLMALP
jgi:hypothetical protein